MTSFAIEHSGESNMAPNATIIVDPFFGIFNGSLPYMRVYSPLMLNGEWPQIARLVFVLFAASFGTTMNGFFISSFFVEHTLMSIGNVYLACTGLTDMMVTAVVMSISAVVLLSGQWDNLLVCRAAQIIAEAATYSYSWFFLMVSLEHYYRICRTSAEYIIFINMRIDCISLLIFIFGFILAAGGVLLDLDYDYCERRSYGSTYFRISTTVLFHGMCTILTLYCFLASILKYRRRAQEHTFYKRSRLHRREYALSVLNLTAYLLFIVAWIPYVVVVNEFPGTSDAQYYNSVWIGLLRSVFTSFIYGITNRNFRRAYGHIFNYCCCKSTLSGSFSSRHRRALEFKSATGDVRVHIMHQAVTGNSPFRGASTSQETQDL